MRDETYPAERSASSGDKGESHSSSSRAGGKEGRHRPRPDHIARHAALDEPTTGLDPRSKLDVQRFVRS